MPAAGCLSFYANLSGMLPQRPSAFDPDFDARISHAGISHTGAGRSDQPLRSSLPDLPQLQPPAHRPPLQAGLHPCGYYLSCADYY